MMSSNKDDWETPQDLFNRLDEEFYFTLDVCASDTNYKCKEYITKEEDGLATDWGKETCWMNPPYGRQITKWVEKAYGSKAMVVALLPARTDTKWFHDFIYNKAEIRFIKGRLKFSGSKNSAPFPSMIVIWKTK